MNTAPILQFVLFVVLVAVGYQLYSNSKEPNRIKPYTLKDIYLSKGQMKEGLLLDCRIDEREKFRHLRAIRELRERTALYSTERERLEELDTTIELGSYRTDVETSTAFFEREIKKLEKEIDDMTIEKARLLEETKRLQREIDKLTSFQKFSRRL